MTKADVHDPAGGAAAARSAVAPQAAERMAVSVKEANVRAGAAAQLLASLWKVEKYHPIEVLEASGVWLRFKDFEGDGGWIHKSMVDKTPASSPSRTAASCAPVPAPTSRC